VAIANALQLKGRPTSHQLLCAILYYACAQTASSQHPIKILTSPLNSSTPISQHGDQTTFSHCDIDL